MRAPLIIFFFVIAFILIKNVCFVLDEREQAIITQLGKYIRTVRDAGLHLKIPFLQRVHRFEKRVLEYDAAAAKIITKDKKHLVIDNYARWKIIDPLRFYQTVKNEIGAQTRLDDIIFSQIREELARHTLTEIVSVNREKIMEKVSKRCDERAREFGIQIIDVRIKRADLPEEVAHSVYNRMRAERERIAKKYRSQGAEEAAKIRAEAEKERTIILAEAYRKAEKIRGEGDARAIRIYAKAFQRAPQFYSFLRTLEAYKKTLSEDTTVVLSTDSEFLQFLGRR